MSRADQNAYQLCSAQGAGASSGVNVLGGIYMLYLTGTVGTGAISLQMLAPDGSTWCPIQAIAGSSPVQTTTLPFGATQIYLPPGQVRINVAAGGSPSVNGWLVGVG